MSVILVTLKNLLTGQPLAFAIGSVAYKFIPKVRFAKNFIKTFSLFILLSLGIKGGIGLFNSNVVLMASIAVVSILLGFALPFISFAILRRFTPLSVATSAAVSASFGSISVMTFVLAVTFLEVNGIPFQPALVGVGALMEVPAIFSGVYLAKRYLKQESSSIFSKVITHCIKDRSVQALFAGLILGVVSIPFGLKAYTDAILTFWPVSVVVFLFLLGMNVISQISPNVKMPKSVIAFGVLMPCFQALIGLGLSFLFSLDAGTAALFATLVASASYIAVPAIMPGVLPEAEEGIYVPLALLVTFPFNALFGIPLYTKLAGLWM